MIYNFFDGAKEANLYEIKSRKLRSEKVVIGIDIDNIENVEDLLRVVFIDEECGNLKVVVENLLETLTKRRSHIYVYRSSLCDKCCRRGHFFNKQVKYC